MCCACAYTRVLKVARTIADLPVVSSAEASAKAGASAKAEAIQYRTLDRDLWA